MIGWVPVCLACGIGGYFSLSQEPDALFVSASAAVMLCLIILARLASVAVAPLFVVMVLVLAGAGLAKVRVDTVAAPVLGFRYYGPIEGRIVNIDRSSSEATRLTLDQVVLARMSPDRTPVRVRVSLHGDQPLRQFLPGDV